MLPKMVTPDAKDRITLGHLDNKNALKKVFQGLKDAAAGRISEKGSFAKFIDDDI